MWDLCQTCAKLLTIYYFAFSLVYLPFLVKTRLVGG